MPVFRGGSGSAAKPGLRAGRGAPRRLSGRVASGMPLAHVHRMVAGADGAAAGGGTAEHSGRTFAVDGPAGPVRPGRQGIRPAPCMTCFLADRPEERATLNRAARGGPRTDRPGRWAGGRSPRRGSGPGSSVSDVLIIPLPGQRRALPARAPIGSRWRRETVSWKPVTSYYGHGVTTGERHADDDPGGRLTRMGFADPAWADSSDLGPRLDISPESRDGPATAARARRGRAGSHRGRGRPDLALQQLARIAERRPGRKDPDAAEIRAALRTEPDSGNPDRCVGISAGTRRPPGAASGGLFAAARRRPIRRPTTTSCAPRC